MSESIPHAVIPTAAGVLIVSIICLLASLVLSFMLIRHNERVSYIALISYILAVSTLANIIQQTRYCARWRTIQIAGFEQAKMVSENPYLIVVGVAEPGQIILHDIQYYCYNALALLILFWCIVLCKGVWTVEIDALVKYEKAIGWASKIFALVTPAIFEAISETQVVKDDLVTFLILKNIILCASLTFGSAVLISTLWRYLENRRKLASISSSSGATIPTLEIADSRLARREERRQKRDEMWLIIRFTSAFVVFGIWELCIFSYQVIQVNNNEVNAKAKAPDFSVGKARADLVTFLPGCSASFFAWLVFGTTAEFRREYVKAFRKCFSCCIKERPRSPPVGQHDFGYSGHPRDVERQPIELESMTVPKSPVPTYTTWPVELGTMDIPKSPSPMHARPVSVRELPAGV